MRNHLIAALTAGSLLAAGCATVEPPKELVAARAQYETAMKTQTAAQNPAGLYDAKKALDVANQAYDEDPKGEETKDFAYLALRKVELANAKASSELAMQQKGQITQSRMKATEQSLTQTKEQLAASKAAMKDQSNMSAEQIRKANEDLARANADLEKEKTAREAAEKKAQAVSDELARVSAVKKEVRGIVLTLSGAVMFTSNQATLLPGARTKLDDVAAALQKAESSGFVVEGHTDSQGSDATNQDLSQRRAQTVRDYLVSKGVPNEDITAVGYGKTRPIADNNSAEGRANNRRVEIVIKPPNSVSQR